MGIGEEGIRVQIWMVDFSNQIRILSHFFTIHFGLILESLFFPVVIYSVNPPSSLFIFSSTIILTRTN